MKKIIATLIERLKEPSTWAGLAAIGALFGMEPERFQEIQSSVAAAFVAVAGLVAVIRKEKGAEK